MGYGFERTIHELRTRRLESARKKRLAKWQKISSRISVGVIVALFAVLVGGVLMIAWNARPHGAYFDYWP